MKWIWLMVGLIALSGMAKAAQLTGYPCQGWGLSKLTGPSICGTAPSPPVTTCDGTIDLSTGCTMPMLR